MKVTKKELAPLAQFINQQYEGDLFAISRYLDKAVYMLAFLEEDSFLPKDVQNVCYVLHEIKEVFFQAHQDRLIDQHRQAS